MLELHGLRASLFVSGETDLIVNQTNRNSRIPTARHRCACAGTVAAAYHVQNVNRHVTWGGGRQRLNERL